ncbi:MAG: hypothetical protein KME08_01725 [Aphanothece sp. CMT-3BRIN-NPC111]|jgi:acyl-coenzyme A synthetase/AMP-(fatty) acid ligase|nr:hypothetical protein [Aphanothece sp. CMT-3BRIN-NPC111]
MFLERGNALYVNENTVPIKNHFTDVLLKTRSGKVRRRLWRSLASDQEVAGDIAISS